MSRTSDLRIRDASPLPSPQAIKRELAAGPDLLGSVAAHREAVAAILRGEDSRMLAVVGPCSIHDPRAALDYAQRLAALAGELADRLLIIMRVYFEKPRTTVGWRGLIVDPHLDGSNDLETGLRTARQVLLDIASLGLPAGSELLDPIVPQYIDELLTWASIGARTTESQTHREMASGLSMPVGFKNGTDGSVQVAVNAMASARTPHSFLGIDAEGRTCILHTTGNPDSHLILRGGTDGPNYGPESVRSAREALSAAGLPPRIVVDCSHGNSRKQPDLQPGILAEVMRQRRNGERALLGFMMESNIAGGRQDTGPGMRYGCSITDPCLDWAASEAALRGAAAQAL